MAEMMTSHMNGNEHTTYEKKYVYKEDHNDDKEYASRGVGGTALGLSIGALALTLLGRNGNILNNVLGNPTPENAMNSEFFQLYKSQTDADFALYKDFRDQNDTIIAKHNADAFALYKYSRDGFDVLQNEIGTLKSQLAMAEAVQPWKDKSIYDAIALEAERRQSADCAIVGYTNCTFYPVNVADVTVSTTSTPKTLFNPLSCLNNRCGC